MAAQPRLCQKPRRQVFSQHVSFKKNKNYYSTVLPHKKLAILPCSSRFLYCLSRVLRKPAFCICENKDADQLRGNREADQRLCFRYTDSTIPLLPKSEMSSLELSSVVVQPGLCRTWSKTPKTGFLTTRLVYSLAIITVTQPLY